MNSHIFRPDCMTPMSSRSWRFRKGFICVSRQRGAPAGRQKRAGIRNLASCRGCDHQVRPRLSHAWGRSF